MDAEFSKMLSDANIVFTIIFAFEMGIKLIGLHPYYYFQNTWNIFDAFIVTMSLLEFLLVNVNGFSVLRTFRYVLSTICHSVKSPRFTLQVDARAETGEVMAYAEHVDEDYHQCNGRIGKLDSGSDYYPVYICRRRYATVSRKVQGANYIGLS